MLQILSHLLPQAVRAKELFTGISAWNRQMGQSLTTRLGKTRRHKAHQTGVRTYRLLRIHKRWHPVPVFPIQKGNLPP